MHRGLEIGLHLAPGLSDENFVGLALGNLAAFEVGRERGETLRWQVVRVDGATDHHFRLLLSHPDRPLDLGFRRHVERVLSALSRSTVDELRDRFEAAQRDGLRPVALRHLHEAVDFWRDDFWNWLG